MDAIVYTSNSGFTAEYARLLGEKTGLPVFSLSDAVKSIRPSSDILYLGWLMAGSIKGYKKAIQRYHVRAVCGVGMGATGSQTDEVRKANAISDDMPLFTLQGGFDRSRLHGIYKFMMSVVSKTLGKQLAEKQDKTPDEKDMLDLMQNGGNRVSIESLSPVLAWLDAQ